MGDEAGLRGSVVLELVGDGVRRQGFYLVVREERCKISRSILCAFVSTGMIQSEP
jgi:hypothetical protein